jgi:radical SAM/CxCxxxxC motif protein YfkAB
MNAKANIAIYDPWDPLTSMHRWHKHRLTSVEFTVTQLCNMRCEHCAVGDALVQVEGKRLPLERIMQRLDEVEHLQTISITGGEPSYDVATLEEYIIPLLHYARERGVRSQINTNLTLPFDRYERLAPYIDVFHISFNYRDARDFYEIGFANQARPVSLALAERMYDRLVDNTMRLAQGGAFVSAESMINVRTLEYIEDIHRIIVKLGCRRHEVHPMYPSAFAAGLPVLSLHPMRDAIHRLLDMRDPDVWMLFGTLPFFACNSERADRELIRRLAQEPNVTVRNDPDGRNRLNVNTFNGNVYVTDFSDVPAIGNVQDDRLEEVFDQWLKADLQMRVNCYCPQAQCCGPNLLVANMYYNDVDFTTRKAILT